VIAKTSSYVLDPVLFALHLGIHFVTTYPHINKSQIRLEKLKWSRIVLPSRPEGHNHSFVRDGEEKEVVEVWVDATKGKDALSATITAGVKDLLRAYHYHFFDLSCSAV
jgi:urate oxidase